MSTTTFTNEGHAEKYLQKLWKKCENEDLCDVVLIAGTAAKRIPAHRFVLSEESEYFNGIFASLRECTTKEVKIPNVNGDILQSLVEYCYKGRIVISEHNVVELLKTSHMLQLTDVVKACEKFLAEQLHPSNYFKYVRLAEEYSCELLLEKAKKYCLDYFMEISTQDEFLHLSVEQLSQLLASDDLCASSEEVVFNSILKWMQHDPIKREQHKVELLKLVRVPYLDVSFLIKHVKPICTSFECLSFYMDAIEYHHLPSDSNLASGGNFTKPRISYQLWMGIAPEKTINKMFIHYYCTQQNKWMKCLKEFEYRLNFGSVLMKDCLYIIGGVDAKANVLSTVICLNLNLMTLTEISAMNEGRKWCTAATLNGFLYAVGGFNGSSHVNSVEKWNPETNEWNKVASMSVNRSNAGVIVLNGKLYVVGGWSNSEAVSSAECYDPVQDACQSIAPMGEARQLPGVAVANGLLYAVGGHEIKTVESYNPQTNKWTFICSLHDELFPWSSCTTINDKVVVSCKDRFVEYDAVSDEWKEILSEKHPDNIYKMFSYSRKLQKSQFTEI